MIHFNYSECEDIDGLFEFIETKEEEGDFIYEIDDISEVISFEEIDSQLRKILENKYDLIEDIDYEDFSDEDYDDFHNEDDIENN